MTEKGRKKVACYCSSMNGLPEDVTNGARLIGSVIGKCGAELVYGGVNAGLMHDTALAAHENGAKVTGVIPRFFMHRADAVCDEVIHAEDLNERKGKMITLSDIFIILPGGIGTIDEWVATLSHIMVAERTGPDADKPILVWNHDGMYDGMVKQLNATGNSIYARGRKIDRSRIFHSAEEMAEALRLLLDCK